MRSALHNGRPDGRSTATSLRPLSADMSCLHRADGSAQFASGNTTIMAAVHGPQTPKIQARENYKKGIVSVVFKQGPKHLLCHGMKDTEIEILLANILSSCILLEEYPRSIIEVVIQVLQSDGSVLSVAMNAAVLACIDAGISMSTVPVGTLCLVDPDDTILLDPSSDEEQQLTQQISPAGTTKLTPPSLVFVVTSGGTGKDSGIFAIITAGPSISHETFLKCVETSQLAGRAVVEFIRMVIEQKVERESNTLWANSVN